MSIDMLNEKAKPYYITEAVVQQSFPLGHVDRRTYDMRDAAMVMVGERHKKSDLVDLVAALIHQKQILMDEVSLHRDLQALPAKADACRPPPPLSELPSRTGPNLGGGYQPIYRGETMDSPPGEE